MRLYVVLVLLHKSWATTHSRLFLLSILISSSPKELSHLWRALFFSLDLFTDCNARRSSSAMFLSATRILLFPVFVKYVSMSESVARVPASSISLVSRLSTCAWACQALFKNVCSESLAKRKMTIETRTRWSASIINTAEKPPLETGASASVKTVSFCVSFWSKYDK